MVNKKVDEVEGIGPLYGEKLRGAGVENTDTLLSMGRTPKGRNELAEKTGIERKLVLKWVNMADLFRISGVGPEYAELLERSGVDTVKELKHRNAENLASKMAEINAEKNLTRNPPTVVSVSKWVDQAKELDAMIEY